ncbi:MAG: helix-turn-helix domain-containing protein [Ilumatobacteraceae bacterium]
MTRGNRLLDRLVELHPPFADGAQLNRCDRGEEIRSLDVVVFPVNAVISLLAHSDDAGHAELTLIGREGFLGAPTTPGSGRLPLGVSAQVTIAGSGWMIPADAAATAIDAVEALRPCLMSYVEATQAVIARQVLCNLFHSVDQRVCRWLLTTSDRVGEDSFSITQSFLSERLAVRRASVNVVERRLQSSGAIEYASGTMRLLDREQLADQSCDCYRMLFDQFTALLG